MDNEKWVGAEAAGGSRLYTRQKQTKLEGKKGANKEHREVEVAECWKAG